MVYKRQLVKDNKEGSSGSFCARDKILRGYEVVLAIKRVLNDSTVECSWALEESDREIQLIQSFMEEQQEWKR